jgi:peroxiredoxin
MAKNQWISLALLLFSVACREKQDTSKPPDAAARKPDTVARTAPPTAPGAEPAVIGKEAPDFTLPDSDGLSVHLKDFRGKFVVIEWFNPECPFVRASHTKGSLVDAAKKHLAEGVVWLAVNSAGPGKQGYGAEKTREGKERFGLTHPVLLDESGAVGRLYGAERTPHLYVIDKRGVLVYRGAVDNSPDGEAESPAGGKLVRYVDEALTALRDGKPVAVAETQAYGCSVKYAK